MQFEYDIKYLDQGDLEESETIESSTPATEFVDQRTRIDHGPCQPRSLSQDGPTNMVSALRPTAAPIMKPSEGIVSKKIDTGRNEIKTVTKKKNEEDADHNDDDDSDWDEDDDEYEDDPALEEFRQRRLAELRYAQEQLVEQKAKGHGEVRTIRQDEFLPECTGSSEYVAVHFFHNDFQRCALLDHHLRIVAAKHLSCKFLRIDAEKAPFFVTKLKIQTLPTLVVFQNGKERKRLVGFEGLTPADAKSPDEWPTSCLERWLDTTSAIRYKPTREELEEEEETMRNMKRVGLSSTAAALQGRLRVYDEDN